MENNGQVKHSNSQSEFWDEVSSGAKMIDKKTWALLNDDTPGNHIDSNVEKLARYVDERLKHDK